MFFITFGSISNSLIKGFLFYSVSNIKASLKSTCFTLKALKCEEVFTCQNG